MVADRGVLPPAPRLKAPCCRMRIVCVRILALLRVLLVCAAPGGTVWPKLCFPKKERAQWATGRLQDWSRRAIIRYRRASARHSAAYAPRSCVPLDSRGRAQNQLAIQGVRNNFF